MVFSFRPLPSIFPTAHLDDRPTFIEKANYKKLVLQKDSLVDVAACLIFDFKAAEIPFEKTGSFSCFNSRSSTFSAEISVFFREVMHFEPSHEVMRHLKHLKAPIQAPSPLFLTFTSF